MYAFFLSGKPSKLREIYHGDILQFGSLVTQIAPIITNIFISDMDGVNWSKRSSKCSNINFLTFFIRARNSVLFTPAASQEDITVLSSEESDLDLSEAGIKEKSGEDEDVRAGNIRLRLFQFFNVPVANVQGEHDCPEGEAAGDAEGDGVPECQGKGLRGASAPGRGGGGDHLRAGKGKLQAEECPHKH